MSTSEIPVVDVPARSKQLPLFEGKRYPDVELALTGGIKGDAEFLMPAVTGLKIGEAFTLVVSGYVASKKHGMRSGDEVRTLVVTLKIDDVREENEPE